jgi:hypothetical protein
MSNDVVFRRIHGRIVPIRSAKSTTVSTGPKLLGYGGSK